MESEVTWFEERNTVLRAIDRIWSLHPKVKVNSTYPNEFFTVCRTCSGGAVMELVDYPCPTVEVCNSVFTREVPGE